MKYAIYFTWKDGTEDSFNVLSAKERDLNIKDMIRRGDFTEITFCPIYSSGEYGARKRVKFLAREVQGLDLCDYC